MFAKVLSHAWWVILLRGFVWIAFGVSVFAWPEISLLTLALLFGATVLLDGVGNTVGAVSARKEHEDWWMVLLLGLAGIAVGIVTLMSPGLTALALVLYVAMWAIATGVLQIVAAIRLRKEIRGELWLGFAGGLSVAAGVVLAGNPASGALALLWLIGGFTIAFGICLVALAFRVHGLAKYLGASHAAPA